MAVAEKVILKNPATRLYTPKYAPRGRTRAMTPEEVRLALNAVGQRERLLLHMAIFAGFRPGEMLALQRRHVTEDATVVRVEQRVYLATSIVRRQSPHGVRWRSRPGRPNCCESGCAMRLDPRRTHMCSPAKEASRSGKTP